MIVCEPTSGLTSRMYVITDAYEMAARYGQKLIIIWRKTSDCDCRYDQVFDDSQFDDVEHKVYECNQFDFKFSDLRNDYNIRMLYKAVRELFIRTGFTIKHSFVYKYYRSRCSVYKNSYEDNNKLFDERRAEGRDCFFEAYNCITGKGNIRNIKFRQKFLDESHSVLNNAQDHCVGVHIRRTDHGLAKAGSTTDKFIIRMNEEISKDPDVQFYLATDDWDEQKKMQELYGDRILTQQGKILERCSSVGMHSSIIDVLCLSMTQYILGSNSSIFSKFAAEYGGIDLYIV